MNMTILSPLAGLLDEALEQRAVALAPPASGFNPRVLMHYIGKTLMTMGHYCNAADAKGRCMEVSVWIELGESRDEWRSTDGRWIISK